jgi:hypothetical protein
MRSPGLGDAAGRGDWLALALYQCRPVRLDRPVVRAATRSIALRLLARGLSGQACDDGRLPPKLSAASRDSIRENRQAFIASVRWRSFYCGEVRAAEPAFL